MSTQQKKPQTPKANNSNNNQKPAPKPETKAPAVAAQSTPTPAPAQQSQQKQPQQQKPETPKQQPKQQNQKPQSPAAQTKKPQSPAAPSTVVIEATSSASTESPAATTSKQAAPESSMPKQFPAIVKAVLSGDTFVLVHPEKPVEKTITLASIRTPALARKSKEGKQDEQPFAFAAREFIRKKIIGKRVEFQWTYKSAGGRDYGNVYLTETRENLAISLLREGLAEVLKKEGKASESEEYRKLKTIEEQAQAEKKGKWTDDKAVIQKNTRKANEKSNGENVFRQLKGKPVNVIVEYVINGSTMKVYIPQTNDLVLMNLTGIQAPGFTKGGDKKKQPKGAASTTTESEQPEEKATVIAKPFAQEALRFTESRLLHRDVTVIIEGGQGDTIHGTIIRGGVTNFEAVQGPVTFQEDLLSRGLAFTVSYNIGQTKFLPRFKAAENEAKAKKLRHFQNHVEKESSLKEEDKQEVHARILDVLSGDTLRVMKPGGEEEKITLSNVRAPKPGNRVGAGAEEFAAEARDYFRKKLAGKKITFKVDYRKELGGNKEKPAEGAEQQPAKVNQRAPEIRRFCTVLADGKNVAIELAISGYAKVVGGGDERSPYFDQLKNAEADAKQHKRGIHSGKKTQAALHMNDLTLINTQSSKPGVKKGAKEETSKEGKSLGQVQQFIRILKDKKTRAVVEKAYSGTRYKLTLPKDYVVLNFALRSVVAPQLRGKDAKAEGFPRPFAREALYYAIDNVALKDVDVEIEDIDKRGNFVGQIYVNGELFGAKLLKEGLAKTNKSASQLKYSTELNKAQEEAKGKKKGVWSLPEEQYTPKEPRRDRKLKVKAEAKVTTARVTFVSDADTFYFQTSAAERDLAAIDELIAKLEDAPAEIAVGKLALAPYGEEGAYRAKILAVNEDGTAKVQFIDFGNEETVSTETLKGLTEELSTIKPQAREGKLAFVVPHETKFRAEAASFLRELTEGRDIRARIEYSLEKERYYTLSDPAEEISINAQLVANGLLFVYKPQDIISQKSIFETIVEKLEEAQSLALSDHLALWEEGDVYGEEDDE